ncbi:M20 aminoacylase family protein [Halocynthiibacter sp.]|uniref:M20 aminoacylase family protein n=1 Tax=Halocynthiibacter sp. TaxID=1979210 RepID=UPI003C31CF88
MTASFELATCKDQAIAWRHDFHMHPEIAFQEHRTASKVAMTLRSFGLDVVEGLAGTGVVGTLAEGDGPSIALRADMDALPIIEENTFAHASKTHGCMHACGHDGHVAMLLAAAGHLAQTRKFRGTVHFIFQPAEENEAGAKAMIDDGLFDRFNVNAVYGMHNWPGLAVGAFETCEGPIMAAFDRFELAINGQGTHAAMPHLGQDAALCASQLVSALQTIVSRRLNPISPAVVSVTKMHGGDTWNILPQRFTLAGSTRHFDPAVQNQIETEIYRISQGIAMMADVAISFDYQRFYPATFNSPAETTLAGQAATALVGAQAFSANAEPSLGSEDFAFMLQKKPGCYMRVGNGSANGGRNLHSPTYDFNDAALMPGAAYWVKLVETCLG